MDKYIRGQAGGIAVFNKYGRDYMSNLSRGHKGAGGRPRALTIDQIILSTAKQNIKEKELARGSQTTTAELLRLWKERQAASADCPAALVRGTG